MFDPDRYFIFTMSGAAMSLGMMWILTFAHGFTMADIRAIAGAGAIFFALMALLSMMMIARK